MSDYSKDYPPIPLFPRVKKEDITYTKVSNEWIENGVTKRSTHQLPIIDNNEPEVILFAISMFEEHCADDLLCLDTASLKFAKFFTILCGESRDIWRELIEDVKQTDKKFKSSIKRFIAKYLARGDLKIQREYFLTKCFKGRSQTVKDIDLRIRTICRYCNRFPGASKDKFDDEDIKHFIYQAMPPGLKLAFDRAGKTWFDTDLTRAEMVNFLHTVQQSYQQQQQEQHRKRQQQNQGQGQRPQKRHQHVFRQYN